MTLLQKLILFGAVPAALGAGYLQHTEIRTREHTIAQLSREVSRTRQTLQRLQQPTEDQGAVEALASPAAEADALPSSGDPANDERMRSLVRRVYRLKQWIEQSPDRNVPELRFAGDGAWFDVVGGYPQLERDLDLRLASAELKRRAQFSFFFLFQSALSDYLKTSNNVLPARVADLAPYFVCPIDNALLDRYEMCASGPAGEFGVPVVREKLKPNDEKQLETVSCNGMFAEISSVFPVRRRAGQ